METNREAQRRNTLWPTATVSVSANSNFLDSVHQTSLLALNFQHVQVYAKKRHVQNDTLEIRTLHKLLTYDVHKRETNEEIRK